MRRTLVCPQNVRIGKLVVPKKVTFLQWETAFEARLFNERILFARRRLYLRTWRCLGLRRTCDTS